MMNRSSFVNATMTIMVLLACAAAVPPILKGDWAAFLTVLPGIAQAVGGLLAIMATYQIAKESEQRAKRFEEETARREERFDLRAEERAIKAERAADRRMRSSEREAERRIFEAAESTKYGLVHVVRDFARAAVKALDEPIKSVEDDGYSGTAFKDQLEVLHDAVDAVTRISINDAELLREIFEFKRILKEPIIIGYSKTEQDGNARRLKELRGRIVDADKRLSKYTKVVRLTGRLSPPNP